MTITRTIKQLESEIEQLKEQVEYARSSAAAFYFVMECGNCEEDIYQGLNLTALEHRGRPAIPFDMASQTNFHCDHCGANNYTGDFCDAVFTEGGDACSSNGSEDDEDEPDE
jgi:hypothetical protein